MKVDKTKIRYTTELPPDCKTVIERLKRSTRSELVAFLREFQLWNLSKSELAYWNGVLDIFDGILEECSQSVNSNAWCLNCDKPENVELRDTACCVLNFMALLIEHTFGRHIFSSIDRIILLLNTSDVSLLNATLSLLYSFSKRSSFIQRLDAEVHGVLIKKMMSISESWGERENGFSLADCCRHVSTTKFPRNPLSFSFEYYYVPDQSGEPSALKSKRNLPSSTPSQMACLRCDLADSSYATISTGEIMVKLLNENGISEAKHQQLFHRLRLARGFNDYSTRLQLIESRLLTLTTLIYCRNISASALTTTFIEEVAELLQLDSNVVGMSYINRFSQLKGAALKLLTALVHAELNGYKKLGTIIDCLGVNDYHGFLPSLFRQTVQNLLEDSKPECNELTRPNGFTTCIFSLLYHMATIEPTGSGALLAAGLVEPLLKVVSWYSRTEENLAYVTRAVRVVNLICDYDATSFFQLGGLGICVQRLEHDVGVCRSEEPFEIQPEWLQLYMDPPSNADQESQQAETVTGNSSTTIGASSMEVTKPENTAQKSVECSQQRMALLKSLLGFFKDLFANQTHADQIRRVMDAAVPRCLRHIISNPQYYGPTVFLNAIDLVTRYIYQEPSLLSQLQESGFTSVVLFALIIRDVPATREVLSQLPAAFSALCLNQRGLQTFVRCRPFDRLMKFLFSPEYLPAMQRRAGGKDAGGNSDTARSLGLAVDDMMRHQPALRPDTMRALVKLLEQLGVMGRDKSATWAGVVTASEPNTDHSNSNELFQPAADDGGSTSGDDEDGVNLPPIAVVGRDSEPGNNQNSAAANTSVQPNTVSAATGNLPAPTASGSTASEPVRRKPPVTEFIYNTMRFMEAMLSSNATDDHCTAFAEQGGVKPLLSLLALPHLPLDFAGYQACDSIAAVIKSMIGLSRSGQLITKAFELLNEQLRIPVLQHFSANAFQQTSSLLWTEATKVRTEDELADPVAAPLIRSLSAVHSILSMLFHLSSNQQEVRSVLLQSWSSSEGLSLLNRLIQLYTALIWEFSLLVIEADSIAAEYRQHIASSSGYADDKMETAGESSSMEPAPSAAQVTALNERVKFYKFVAGLVADQLKTFHQLFIHLVRLAAATPSRRARLGMMVPPVTPASHCLATAGCQAIHATLSASLPASAETKAKLKYYQIAAGTLSWLYDDNNQPYHILLSYFTPLGCRDALKWVLDYLLTLDPTTVQPQVNLQELTNPNSSSTESGNRPVLPPLMNISVDSTLSDLLTELRRLCSTSVVVDSPNTLQPTGANYLAGLSQRNNAANGGSTSADFDANGFVASMQSVAFSLLQQAWFSPNRGVPTSNVAHLFVDIMYHVVGSPELTDRSKETEGKSTEQQSTTSTITGTETSGSISNAAATSASSLVNVLRDAASALEPPVSQDHLQQLCDMGFPREQAIEALLNTTNLEMAADYCLTHPAPPPLARPTTTGINSATESSTSTGQALPSSAGSGNDLMSMMPMNIPLIARPRLSEVSDTLQGESGKNIHMATKQDQQMASIDPSQVSAFLSKIFEDLLLLVESNQLIVPKVASLLSSAMRAKQAVNGSSLFFKLLQSTIRLIEDASAMSSADGKRRLAARLYLASLLLNGIKIGVDCSDAKALANRLVALLANTDFEGLESSQQNFLWIAPAVCYIDVYIESAVGAYLRSFTLKALEKPHRWQWYKQDDRQPKWFDYSPAECRLLDAAYKRGQPTVRLAASNNRPVALAPQQGGSRRSYTIDLRKMKQIAEDSGTGRRIRIATVHNKTEAPANNDTMEVDENSSVGGPAREFDFAISEKYRLVEFCVRILSLEDSEGACHQSVLLLLARLTSEAALCTHFFVCGGLNALLKLPATPTILSLSSVVMLLLRHILEDVTTIRAMMERLCRTLVGQPSEREREREMLLGHMGGISNQHASKEFHYFVQLMAPLICKNMDLWQEVCENVVRLQPSSNNKPDDDERGGTSAVYCKLAAHLQHGQNQTNAGSSKMPGQVSNSNTTIHSTTLHQHPNLNESASTMVRMLLALVYDKEEEETEEAAGTSTSSQSEKQVEQKGEKTAAKRGKLFSRNFVLRALAELVRAAPIVSQLVVHYQHQPVLLNATEASESIPTALSLIFDDLLTRPAYSNSASRLIAALAACYQIPEAQTGLVNELKLALSRALAQPESPLKHRHLRCLAEAIQLMIQVCPSQQQAPLPASLLGRSEKMPQMNNIIRLMYKRGLLSDLSKTIHSLDLSSPELATTVNALLNPLDMLCRAVNAQHLHQQLQAQRNAASNANASDQQQQRQQQQQQQQTETQPTQQAHSEVMNENAEDIAVESGAQNEGISAPAASNVPERETSEQTAPISEVAGNIAENEELEESLGHEAMPADGPTMEHILERLLNDNHSAEISHILGIPQVNIGGGHRQLIAEEMSSDDEDEDDNDENNHDENDTMVERGADDSQVREDDNVDQPGVGNAVGSMEVGEVDDDFESADEGDDDDNEDGEIGEEEEDEEGVMEEDDDTEADDDEYGDDQESGATEAISDEAGDHVHGFIPGDIDLMLGPIPADDTPTMSQVAIVNANNAPAQLPSTAPVPFAHPLLSRAAVSAAVGNRPNMANLGTSAGPIGILGGGGGGSHFRAPRGIGFFPRQRQHAGNLPAMVFEELNADFFRHVFGDLFSGDDVDYRGGIPGGHFDQFIADSNRRHGIYVSGTSGSRVRGVEGFFQDAAGGWQTIGGIDFNGRLDSPSSAMADVPATLQRWSEEARLLYGSHIHDMVLAADRRLYNVLYRIRESEIKEQQRQHKEAAESAQSATAATTEPDTSNALGISVARPSNRTVSGATAAGRNRQSSSRQRAVESATSSESMETLSNVVSIPSEAQPHRPVQPQPAEQPVDDMQNLANLISFRLIAPNNESNDSPAQPSTEVDSTSVQPMDTEGASSSVSPSRQMEVASPQTAAPEESIAAESTTGAPDSNSGEAVGQAAEEQNNEANTTSAEDGSQQIPTTEAASGNAAAAEQPSNPLDGIDPSFLEALPENIRQEVIAEHVRLERMRRQLRESRDVLQRLGIPQEQVSEISPEFLEALPPNIQEEIVAAQQAERARLLDEQRAASNSANAPTSQGQDTTETAEPAQPSQEPAEVPATSEHVPAQQDGSDPATFLATLPANLRQQVLADMDDSVVNILPADLAAEARRLRQEAEERHARVLQQRLNDIPSSFDFVYGLRPSGVGRGRFAAFRTSLPIGRAGRPFGVQLSRDAGAEARAAAAESAVKQLLDHEGLSCLIVLLFVTESRTYANRLKSLLLCLCQHKPTRVWIIDSLISVLKKAADSVGDIQQKNTSEASGWLNIGIESALGGRTRVFQLPQLTGKRSTSHALVIGIHPLAATTVCRQALDILQALAKNFPSQFIQPMYNPLTIDSNGNIQPHSCGQGEPDFWEVLLKLDNMLPTTAPGTTPSTPSKRSRVRSGFSGSSESTSGLSLSSPTASGVENTPISSLIILLSGANIRKSQQLTDKILGLMNMVSHLPSMTNLVNECLRNDNKEETTQKSSGSTSQEPPTKPKESGQPIIPKLLPIVIKSIIKKACSEEGLEDATSLLAHLSHVNKATCETIKTLLTGAAREVGQVVCSNVRSLLVDIDRVCPPPPPGEATEGTSDASTSSVLATGSGKLTDRYTGTEVIISAPKKSVILPADLQLPSVSLFTCRSASQRYLLRILKAIGQLMNEQKVPNANSRAPGSAISRQVQQFVQQSQQLQQSQQQAKSEAETPATESVMLAEQLELDELWQALSDALTRLEQSADPQAVLLLQPAVEAFFIVHSKPKDRSNPPSSTQNASGDQPQTVTQHIVPPEPMAATTPVTPIQPPLPPDQQLFVHFAEKHRVVLNQILRQSTQPLSDGPFAVLTDFTRILDFDVKRRYFRQALERMDEGRRRDDLAVHIRRLRVFDDSYRELHRRSAEEWKARFFIIFDGEEGQDAGGLLREWFVILSREIFNPHYALFRTSPGDRVTYCINELSSFHPEHLSYFKFVGQLIAKAIYENKMLDCYFTRSFYKHILGIPVKYTDMESEDYTLYRNLVYLLEHNAADLGLDLTFSTEVPVFGDMRIRDLKENGRNLPVTEENKREYVQLLCQMKMTGAIEKQLDAFLDGFYSIIPRRLISIFNEQELELLICGLPTVDIEDLRHNTEYHKYQPQSLQIQWLWRALRSFSDADCARFMQFVTGTSKVPLGGFANLEGMHGAQKFQIHRDDRSTERLPTAHTCFNQLDLPPYETYDKLREMLLIAITEGSEGFGFA